MKVSVAQLNPTIGDFSGNRDKILQALETGKQQKAQLVLFSECVITGYPAEDFLLLPGFVERAEDTLHSILPHTKDIAAIIGLPSRSSKQGEKPLYNSAAIAVDGHLLGFQHKFLLPTYDVFDERRHFETGNEFKTWDIFGEHVAITICEDIWEGSETLTESKYFRHILENLKKENPSLFVNLSASPYHQQKIDVRIGLCQKAAVTLQCPVILCNQVGGNDSLIFDGHSLSVDPNGYLLRIGKGFAEDQYLIETHAKASPTHYHYAPEEELYHALVLGIQDYFHKSGLQKACLGLSGGIDSAVVACLAVDALGSKNVLGVLMPSRYSSQDSLSDAYTLIKRLQIPTKEIAIEDIFTSYLSTLELHFEKKTAHDLTEENLQARIRGMLLMALSNKLGYTVLSTGNKSELAMGYCTLYGDMCGGLAPIGDLTKTNIYNLAKWINRNEEKIPLNSITKAPSAELRPNQKDSDTLPDYEVLDNILTAHIERYTSPKEIANTYDYPVAFVEAIIRSFYRNEFKRRQAPPSLRVSPKAFYAGRKFPIVQKFY